MDDIGALLGLFLAMTAYLDKGFDDMFKCIYLIVPNDQGAGFLMTCHHVYLVPAVC